MEHGQVHTHVLCILQGVVLESQLLKTRHQRFRSNAIHLRCDDFLFLSVSLQLEAAKVIVYHFLDFKFNYIRTLGFWGFGVLGFYL